MVMTNSRNFVQVYESRVALGAKHDEARDRAEKFTGKVVLIRVDGPPRSGKSALLELVADMLRERGITAAWVAGRQHEMRVLVEDPGRLARDAPVQGGGSTAETMS
jgi:hypothetical protein